MAAFKTNRAQIIEIKASDLDRDILDILEGIVELTPVDPTAGMWLIEMGTLLETLDDEGLEEGYEDAFKDKWEAFVKEVDTINTISKCKYVMIVQNMDDVDEGDVSETHTMENINFLNYYHCSCGETWHQEADSMCNDRCPSCNKEIEPYESIDLIAKKSNNKPIYKRYCIVQEIDDNGTETLEDYNDYETCYEAFEAIRENGYHVPENAYDPSNPVTFDEFDKVVLTMKVELCDDDGNHEGFETIDYVPIILHSGKLVMEYCVTAVFDDEPDANHTKWFSSIDEARAYIKTMPEANAAIGKRLTLTEATKLIGKKEIVFIFDDGTESVWDGGEIDEVYADQPMAIYI